MITNIFTMSNIQKIKARFKINKQSSYTAFRLQYQFVDRLLNEYQPQH